jgi:hypothetical protein
MRLRHWRWLGKTYGIPLRVIVYRPPPLTSQFSQISATINIDPEDEEVHAH